jgi:hypothetical protein
MSNKKPKTHPPQHIVYELRLTFAGPLLSQQSGTLRLGVDAAMQRYREQPAINGSLVRGNIRDYLGQIAEALPENKSQSLLNASLDWFGQPSSDGEMEPRRGNVRFDLFWLLQSKDFQNGHRTRIQLGELGSVETGALQTIEDCFPAGTKPVFSGKLRATFKDQEERQRFEKWINKTLSFIPAMGSLKGIGYGRLLKADLKPVPATAAGKKTPLSLPAGTIRFGISLHVDRPFCIGKPRTPDSNRVVSDDFISGNVIKAVIANQYTSEQDREDALCFDQLVFSHAFPAQTAKRHPPLPLSLAFYRDKLVDMSGLDNPQDFPWQDIPAFQPDWKDKQWGQASTDCDLSPATPERLLLVRTEISRDSGTAEEGRLFSVECVDPQGFAWYGNVDLSLIPEERRPQVLKNLLACLQQGLDGIGKTKAYAQVNVYPQAFATPHGTMPPVGGTAIVTLMSDARLLPANLEHVLATQWQTGTQSDNPLHSLYAAYWANMAEKSLSLQRHFAQQKRRGGAYQHQHFQKRDAYAPEWLTVAGSVFVLKVETQAGLEKLQQWMLTGLPAHPVANGQPATWKDTPYLPEHGFGEICINWYAQTERPLQNGGDNT